jgi:TMEM175 potassium channel family protein
VNSDEEPSLGFERVVFFSDAVFAIVITLLVLPLTAEFDVPDETHDLAQHVRDLWPNVLGFMISFIVIGQFWMTHHRMFGNLSRSDPGLLWLNLLLLMSVSFLPFPTVVLAAPAHDEDRFPAVFYAASITLTSLMVTVTWLYAVRRSLVAENIDRRRLHEITTRSLVTSGIFLLSVGAAFASLALAVFFWVALVPAARVLTVRQYRRAAARTES